MSLQKLFGWWLSAGVLLGSCGHKPQAVVAPLPVEAVAIDSIRPESDVASYPAVVRRDREADLSLRIAATLIEVPAQIGQYLPRGALVARADVTAYQPASGRASAEVARLTRAVARNDALVAVGAISATERDDTRSALAAARAALAGSRYDLRSGDLRMPFSGIVLSRDGEAGQNVGPGQRIVSVADTGSGLLARVAVPPLVASRLRSGMPATFRLPPGRTISARIRRVGAATDMASGTVTVDLDLPPGLSIASGTTGSASFATGEACADGQPLPAEALLDSSNGLGHVFVVDTRSGTARQIAVRVLAICDGSIRVTGVPVGARVITAGAGFVANGQPVAVTLK